MPGRHVCMYTGINAPCKCTVLYAETERLHHLSESCQRSTDKTSEVTTQLQFSYANISTAQQFLSTFLKTGHAKRKREQLAANVEHTKKNNLKSDAGRCFSNKKQKQRQTMRRATAAGKVRCIRIGGWGRRAESGLKSDFFH